MSTLKKITTLTLVLLLLIGAIAVSSLNADPVTLNLYWLELNWPLGFTLLLCGTMGILAGLVIAWLYWIWPANRRKMYWKRAYFKLKAEQPAESPEARQLEERSKGP